MGNQRARSRGLRHGTRNMFSRPFRKKGALNSTTFLRTFRVRDFPHPAIALRKHPPARHETLRAKHPRRAMGRERVPLRATPSPSPATAYLPRASGATPVNIEADF
jgi:hypothetical protein